MKPLNRRTFIALGGIGLISAAVPVFAMTTSSARKLVDQVVGDINAIINSGDSEAKMLVDFEGIFENYGDISIISRSTLGPPARTASAAELAAYSQAFQGYMSRKYGRRFREFIGAEIKVQGARKLKSFVEVRTVARLKGSSPFEVSFMVSDKSGEERFFDLVIEGISLLKAERTEIGAMLDKRRGNIDALIKDLQKAG